MSVIGIHGERLRAEFGVSMPKISTERVRDGVENDVSGSENKIAYLTRSHPKSERHWPFIYTIGLALAGSAVVSLLIIAAIHFL